VTTSLPSSPVRTKPEEETAVEEDLARNLALDDTDEDAQRRTIEEEAYLAYLENQKRLALNLGANFGPFGGFQLGGGLGPGQTGLGAGVQLGPLGFKLGGGLGLQQSGLGAGLQLGSLGLGASTGFSNGGLGLNANAGLGNNYLGYGNHYSQYRTNEEADSVEESESKTEEEEAYLAYLENQKRLLSLKLGGHFGSLGGFNVGAGLGPGMTGLGANANLGPLGVNLGGGLGFQQTGLGAGVQLGNLGIGASTGYKNYGLGFNGNAGLGNNYLGYGNHYTPYAYHGRTIGGGLGVQLGPLGAGVSAGLGNGGVGFNANAGLGQFTQYGTPAHYSQYWNKRPSTQYGPWVSAPVQSRRLGFGLGANLGPIGAGASAGIGHGQVGLSGGFGFGGKYAKYGSKSHYQQYYAVPNRGPWFGPQHL